MSMKRPQQQGVAYVATAPVLLLLLVMGLCNGVNSQQMLDGAEDIGLIGSMRHQTNVVPTQRNQLIRDQIIANEHDHTAMAHLQAKMKREAPAGSENTAAAAASSTQQAIQATTANATTTNDKDKSESSSPPSSFSSKLKEQLNKAGQQIQNYGDQLVAQIPKRLRRQAHNLDHLAEHGTGNSHGIGHGNGYSHNSDGLSNSHGHGHGQGSGYGYGNHNHNHNHDNNEDYGNSNGHSHSHSHSNTNSGSNSGSSSNSKLAELGEKLNSARQLVQTIRERCAEGYRQPSQNERPQRLRRQDNQDLSSERASKLGELGEKLRNRTNEAQRMVQNIRQHCAESLGSTGQGREREPIRHKRQAPVQPQPAAAAAPVPQQQTPVAAPGGAANSPLAAFTDQVRNQTSTAIQQLQSLRDQFVASVGPMIEKQIPKRLKRQIQYPTGSPEQAPQVGTNGQSSGGIMKYLNDLGQQANQAQAISQFLQAAGASGSQKTDNPLAALGQSLSPSSSSSSPSGGLSSVAQVMSQLTDLIKSTQDRNARLLESNQRSLEATNQQTVEAAKSAQGGIQSALSEMGQGLQKLAANNPNLLPDIKNLYQTVSSRLSSASSAVAQTANSGQQEPARSLPVAQS